MQNQDHDSTEYFLNKIIDLVSSSFSQGLYKVVNDRDFRYSMFSEFILKHYRRRLVTSEHFPSLMSSFLVPEFMKQNQNIISMDEVRFVLAQANKNSQMIPALDVRYIFTVIQLFSFSSSDFSLIKQALLKEK